MPHNPKKSSSGHVAGELPVDSVDEIALTQDWEVELDEPDSSQATLVDPDEDQHTIYATITSQAVSDRQPIVPAWLRNGDQRKAVTRWAAAHIGHTAAYHATRAPKYIAKTVLRAPIGLMRIIASAGRWVLDTEASPLRTEAVQRGDIDAYVKLMDRRNSRVKGRLIALAVLSVLATVLCWTAIAVAPFWIPWLVLAILVAVLGWMGSPKDRPLLDRAIVVARARKLTAEIVTRAYTRAGLCKSDDPVTFPQPIQRDGEGWRTVIDLPYGQTFTQALGRRDKIASGIDVAETQVFLDRDATSMRRLAMWVADCDPFAISAGRTPLAKIEHIDFWQAIPLGVNERGQLVTVSMLWTSLLVGAVPRSGKTFVARLIALAAALDPHVSLHVYDGKGSPDWRAFAQVAHRCGFGTIETSASQPVASFLDDLRGLKQEAGERFERLSQLPVTVCPEGKLTQQLSRDTKFGMPLKLLVVDEVQEYIADPEHGKEITTLLAYLVKVAPAVGMSVLSATQRPDEKALPPAVRDNHAARFALRVTSWNMSDLVLGAGAYSEGLDASRLLPSHKGVGILRGMTDTPQTVRTHLADGRDAERIITRARLLRETAGTLTGHAAGEVIQRDSRSSLLEDVLYVVNEADKMHSETICGRLAEFRPDTYAGWRPEQLAAALKPFRVATGQIWIDGINRRGITKASLQDAIDRLALMNP